MIINDKKYNSNCFSEPVSGVNQRMGQYLKPKTINYQPIRCSGKDNFIHFNNQNIDADFYRANFLAFGAKPKTKRMEDVVKSVKGYKYFGHGLFDKKWRDFVEFTRVGWEFLKKEPLDILKATKEEAQAWYHSLSITETHDTTWVKRFNPINLTKPLATYHTLKSGGALRDFNEHIITLMEQGLFNESRFNTPEEFSRALNRVGGENAFTKNKVKGVSLEDVNRDNPARMQELMRIAKSRQASYFDLSLLEKPIVNPDTGKLNFPCVIFDTETTGINIYPSNRPMLSTPADLHGGRPLDKIIQLGAVKVDSEGNIVHGSEVNQLVNPEMPIPQEATNIHGITDADVSDKPVISSVLSGFVSNTLNGNIAVAYNSKFDVTLLNHTIDEFNSLSPKDIEKRQMALTLDPFILIQRIHPYLGVKKSLSWQYRFLFGKDIPDAHDALADCKATLDVTKYCLYYLDKKAKQNGKVLTLRDVLAFQFGREVPGLGIKLDREGADASKRFQKSYRMINIGVKDFPNGYMISQPTKIRSYMKDVVSEIKPLIGEENMEILRTGGMINTTDATAVSEAMKPPEARQDMAKKGTAVNQQYVARENFKEMLDLVGIKAYGDKSKEEIIELITEKSKQYISFENKALWMKNPKFEDILKGNDMPDIEISRQVMMESQKQN